MDSRKKKGLEIEFDFEKMFESFLKYGLLGVSAEFLRGLMDFAEDLPKSGVEVKDAALPVHNEGQDVHKDARAGGKEGDESREIS